MTEIMDALIREMQESGGVVSIYNVENHISVTFQDTSRSDIVFSEPGIAIRTVQKLYRKFMTYTARMNALNGWVVPS